MCLNFFFKNQLVWTETASIRLTPQVELGYVRDVNRDEQYQATGAQPLDNPAGRADQVVELRLHHGHGQPSDERQQVAQNRGQAVAEQAGQLTVGHTADHHSQDVVSVPRPVGLTRDVTVARGRQPDGHRVPTDHRADH